MKTAKAKDLDRMFDDGEDLSEYMDLANIKPLKTKETKQISISIPLWLVHSLDLEAERRGIARKAIINTALVEWVDSMR